MQSQLKQIQEKLGHLAPEKLAEVADSQAVGDSKTVEDSINSLEQRDSGKRIRTRYARASEEVFHEAWDNDDDAVYDYL